jgi:hypothetical protein
MNLLEKMIFEQSSKLACITKMQDSIYSKLQSSTTALVAEETSKYKKLLRGLRLLL